MQGVVFRLLACFSALALVEPQWGLVPWVLTEVPVDVFEVAPGGVLGSVLTFGLVLLGF